MFKGGKPTSRVTVEQSACPARELAPFCVFRTGRQDCGAPEVERPYGEVSDQRELSSITEGEI